MIAFLFGLSILIVDGRSINNNQTISKQPRIAKYSCPLWIPQNKSNEISKTDGIRIDLNTNHPNAVCLDGSSAVMYRRLAQTATAMNKFHIYFEGGGACVGLNEVAYGTCFDSCKERSLGSLGSSNGYSEFSSFDSGYLSTDSSINPLAWDWNTIYVKYCDGGMFLGDNPDTVKTDDGRDIYYKGRQIVISVFETLRSDYGFEAATDVLISGCSAGGAGVYAHASFIKANYVPNDATFLASYTLPDSAFFLEYQGVGEFISVVRWIYENQLTYNSLNRDCVEYFGEDDAFECNFAENNAQFIDVYMFALQSQYDAFQLNCELGNIINPGPINEWADYFRTTFFDSFLSEGVYSDLHAAYLDSGLRHCGCWGMNTIDGMTSGQAQQEWYYNHGVDDKHIWDQDVTYPCLFECCTYVG